MGEEVVANPVVGQSSKKKWIWISVVSIVVVLLVIGGWMIVNSVKRTAKVEEYIGLSKDAQIMQANCLMKCPMIATLINYENGSGNVGPERTLETYGGVEFAYKSDVYCAQLCRAHTEKKIGIPYEDSSLNNTWFIYNDAMRVWLGCIDEFTQEGIIQCYESYLENYSEEDISSVELIDFEYVPKDFNATNIRCSDTGISFDYRNNEEIRKIGVVLGYRGNTKEIEFLPEELNREGTISIPKEEYYNPDSEYNSFEIINEIYVRPDFVEEGLPEKMFIFSIYLECPSQ